MTSVSEGETSFGDATMGMAIDPEAGPSNQPDRRKATKRVNVDTQGNEVPDAKRNKAVPNYDQKYKSLLLIMHWHEACIVFFGLKSRTQLDDIAELTSIISTCHAHNRQLANGVGSLRDLITENFNFKANGVIKPALEVSRALKAIAKNYGFLYNGTEEDRKRIGALSSIFSLIVCFKSRLTEVRLGNASIKHSKKEENENYMSLSHFGYTNTHSPYLTGCSYNPTIQSSMKQSLGPLTIVINLCMNPDQKYQKSWKEAFCQAYKLVPGIEEMANLIAGTRDKYSAILRGLGDLAIAGITRTSNKAFIPAAFLINSSYNENKSYNVRFAAPLQNFDFALDDTYLTNGIKNIDFSGHGLLNFWNSNAKYQYCIKGDPQKMSREFASQAVFHAALGTHKENLNLLEWMTETPFATRREVGDCFEKRAESGGSVNLDIITFKKFSKLASAAQTDFLRGGVGQVARSPTFSGKFATSVDIDSELFKILKTKVGHVAYTGMMSVDKAIQTIDLIKDSINNRVEKEKMIKYGTTKFYYPCAQSEGASYGEEVDVDLVLKGKFYYEQDNV